MTGRGAARAGAARAPQALSDDPVASRLVHRTRQILESGHWPATRLPVHFGFQARVGRAFETALTVTGCEAGRITGQATIRFNALYLMQDPGAMLREAPGRAAAQLFARAEAAARGRRVGRADVARWLARVAPALAQQVEGFAGAAFDDRPLRLVHGGVAVRCACPGDAAYDVLPGGPRSRLALQEGSLHCERCGRPYTTVPDDVLPADLIEAARVAAALVQGGRDDGSGGRA